MMRRGEHEADAGIADAAADLLGIPYDRVAQAVMTPVAFTKGTDFHAAIRPDAEQVIHWNEW